MIERLRATLVALLALTSCELLAGLDGERGMTAAGGGTAGTANEPPDDGGMGGEAANGNGATAGDRGGSASGIGGTEGARGGTSGALGGASGAGGSSGTAGTAGGGGSGGAAGTAGSGGAPVAIPLATPSCVTPVGEGCSSVDVCIAHYVPAGRFQMGRPDEGSDAFASGLPHEQPAHDVGAGEFVLDKYEVTVGRFRRFVDSYAGPPAPNAGEHPRILGSGWQSEWDQFLPADAVELRARIVDEYISTWTDESGPNDCRPMNWLDWYLAFAFCIWDEGRLPSEAEWEYAAAGGSEERLFPWGATPPDGARAVFGCSIGTTACTTEDLPRVGSTGPLGDGRFGHSDLAGSLAEFVRDQYTVDFYEQPIRPGTSDVMNLTYDDSAPESPQRGGAYTLTGAYLRAAARERVQRTNRHHRNGVRCARAPVAP